MSYSVLKNLRHNGVKYEPGATITDKVIRNSVDKLVKAGVIEKTAETTSTKTTKG